MTKSKKGTIVTKPTIPTPKPKVVREPEEIEEEKENILFNIPLSIDGKQISVEEIKGKVQVNIKGVNQPKIGRTLIYVSVFGKDIYAGRYFDGSEDERVRKAESCAADFNVKLARGEATITLSGTCNPLEITCATIEDKRPS